MLFSSSFIFHLVTHILLASASENISNIKADVELYINTSFEEFSSYDGIDAKSNITLEANLKANLNHRESFPYDEMFNQCLHHDSSVIFEQQLTASLFFEDVKVFSDVLAAAIRTSHLDCLVSLKSFPDLFMKNIDEFDVKTIEAVLNKNKIDPFCYNSDGKNLMHHALINRNMDLFNLLPKSIEYFLYKDNDQKYSFEYLKEENVDIFIKPICDIFISAIFNGNINRIAAASSCMVGPINTLKRIFPFSRQIRRNPQIHPSNSIVPDEVFERFICSLDRWKQKQHHFLAKLKYMMLNDLETDSSQLSVLLFVCVFTKDYGNLKNSIIMINPFVTFNGSNIIHFAIKYSDANLFALLPSNLSYLTIRDSNRKYPSDYICTKTVLEFMFSRFIIEFKKELVYVYNTRGSYELLEVYKSIPDINKPEFWRDSIACKPTSKFKHVTQTMFYATLALTNDDCSTIQNFLINIAHHVDTLDQIFIKCIESDKYDLISMILKVSPIITYQNKNILHFAALKDSIELFKLIDGKYEYLNRFTLDSDTEGNLPINYLNLADTEVLTDLTLQIVRRFFLEFKQNGGFSANQSIDKLFQIAPVFFLKSSNNPNIDLFSEFLSLFCSPETITFNFNCVRIDYLFYKCVDSNRPVLLSKLLQKFPFASTHRSSTPHPHLYPSCYRISILDFAIVKDSSDLFARLPPQFVPSFYQPLEDILCNGNALHTKISAIHYKIFLDYFVNISHLLNYTKIISVLASHLYQSLHSDMSGVIDIIISFLKFLHDFDAFHGSFYFRLTVAECPRNQKSLLKTISSTFNISVSQIYETELIRSIGCIYQEPFMTQLKSFYKDLAASTTTQNQNQNQTQTQTQNHFHFDNFSQFSLKWTPKPEEQVYQRSAACLKIKSFKSLDGVQVGRLKRVHRIKEGVECVECVEDKDQDEDQQSQNSNQIYVLKTFQASKEYYFENECKILSHLDDSSHFYKVISICHQDYDRDNVVFNSNQPCWRILFEHLKFPSLTYAAAESSSVAAEGRLQKMAAQLFLGIEHLHWLGIVHADLKPDNIMVTAEGNIKLIDFGFSFLSATESAYCRGTYETIAPETIKACPGIPDEAVDWWAYGSTLAIWYAKSPLFTDSSPHPDFVPFLYIPSKNEYKVGKVPDKFPPPLRSFLAIFFQPNPAARRLNTRRLLNQIRSEPFFTGIDWSSLEGGVLHSRLDEESIRYIRE